MWEESPIGTWTLEVINDGRSLVELKNWSLVFLGTETHPQPSLQNANAQPISQQPGSVHSDETPQPRSNTNVNQIDPNSVMPHKTPSQPAADVTVSNGANPSSTQQLIDEPKITIQNCIKDASNPQKCFRCHQNFVLLNGKCVHDCPEQYYKGRNNHQSTCLKCYYSCKTCNGPNDYQCSTCFDDAILEEESHAQTYCHNKSLIDQVLHTSRWYYALSIGFLVNFCIIIILIIYIVR